MRVVSDTSPLYNLAAIEQLDLLRLQFEAVLVPPAVARELEPVRETLAGAAIREAMERGQIVVVRDRPLSVVPHRAAQLDEGEAEALALAIDLGLGTILIDEKRGRQVAAEMGLRAVGVLGVLLRAKQFGQLVSLRDCLKALREKAGFYLSDDLMVGILREASED